MSNDKEIKKITEIEIDEEVKEKIKEAAEKKQGYNGIRPSTLFVK